MSPKKRTLGRIPEFRSIQEEAEFWDTHDTTDFEEEFSPVEARFGEKLAGELTIQLDPDILKRLCVAANEKGVSPASLVHSWIVEQLKEVQAP